MSNGWIGGIKKLGNVFYNLTSFTEKGTRALDIAGDGMIGKAENFRTKHIAKIEKEKELLNEAIDKGVLVDVSDDPIAQKLKQIADAKPKGRGKKKEEPENK